MPPAGTTRVAAEGRPELSDTLRRIFASEEFSVRQFGPIQWLANGQAYTTLEPSTSRDNAKGVVRYDTASGQRRVLVPASQLVPAGDKASLRIDDYSWSKDSARLLIFTKSVRVWREKTPGGDNMHYQGTELLLNRLIELGKQFDFMEYPNRTHSLVEGEGTELRLHSLLARYLEEHMPPGPAAP